MKSAAAHFTKYCREDGKRRSEKEGVGIKES
jgi:hypothetical protein